MENKEIKCSCGASDGKIVMACSGASDVGQISDKAARALQIAGNRKMSCLAVIGADITKSIENFKSKDILIIDGCPTACAKRILDNKGFKNYRHLVVTDLGLKKGQSPADNRNVALVLNKAMAND